MRRRRRVGAGRADRQARALGEEIRGARLTHAMSQRELARRAGVATSTIVRVEDGDVGTQLDTIMAIGTAVGIDVVVRAFPGPTPRLRDSGQLAIARQLLHIANPAWRGLLEVPAGDFGRSADLVLRGADEILHVEIERSAIDLQAQYRSALAKRDHLAARHARPVRLVLAIEDSVKNRASLRPHQDLIRQWLPASSRQVFAALRSGRPLGSDGLVWVRRQPA